MIMKHSIDKRYSEADEIVSHNKDSEPCISLSSLNDVFIKNEWINQYNDSKVIFIEEAQFFTDLFEFVKKALADNKTIFVVGLNGDSNQMNFGDIHKLLPLCDDIELLKACCKICMDETSALFSKRISLEEGQVCVGGGEEYIPVCRNHF